ncbi:MAG: hypothetical protein ACHQNT_02505 [Bacteroidia bacterium]
MKKIIILFVVIALMAKVSVAQDYKTGIGLRAGAFWGFNVKHFIAENKALEGILHFRYGGFGICGLYEVHVVAFKVPQLKFYYGFGAHIGFYGEKHYYDNNNVYYGENTTTLGIDGIAALEYKITNIPFVVGVDIKPFIDLINPGPTNWDGALNIRFVF